MSGKEFWKVRDYGDRQKGKELADGGEVLRGGRSGEGRGGIRCSLGIGTLARISMPSLHWALLSDWKPGSALLLETLWYFRNGSPEEGRVWKRSLSWICHRVLFLWGCSVIQLQNIHHIYIASAKRIFSFYCLPCGWHLVIECLENWTWWWLFFFILS